MAGLVPATHARRAKGGRAWRGQELPRQPATALSASRSWVAGTTPGHDVSGGAIGGRQRCVHPL